MTREDIIKMAREAGLEVHPRKEQVRVGFDALMGIDSTENVERFAAIVAAAEREACAKAAEEFLTQGRSPLGRSVGEAIRARGQV